MFGKAEYVETVKTQDRQDSDGMVKAILLESQYPHRKRNRSGMTDDTRCSSKNYLRSR